MLQYIQRLLSSRGEEKGASAVEYGLLVAAIAAVIVLIVFLLGGVIRSAFQGTCDTIIEEGGSAVSGQCN